MRVRVDFKKLTDTANSDLVRKESSAFWILLKRLQSISAEEL